MLTRSEMMARIKSKNTGPERRARALFREMGVRFRSQVRIAGYVRDFTVVGTRVAVEVHGCFWHGHPPCHKLPKTNVAFWVRKVEGNMLKDRTSARAVRRAGWRNVTLWECETDTQWMRKVLRAVTA